MALKSAAISGMCYEVKKKAKTFTINEIMPLVSNISFIRDYR
jgi:hypothetical protein